MSDEQLAQNCARLQGQSLMLKTLLEDLQREGATLRHQQGLLKERIAWSQEALAVEPATPRELQLENGMLRWSCEAQHFEVQQLSEGVGGRVRQRSWQCSQPESRVDCVEGKAYVFQVRSGVEGSQGMRWSNLGRPVTLGNAQALLARLGKGEPGVEEAEARAEEVDTAAQAAAQEAAAQAVAAQEAAAQAAHELRLAQERASKAEEVAEAAEMAARLAHERAGEILRNAEVKEQKALEEEGQYKWLLEQQGAEIDTLREELGACKKDELLIQELRVREVQLRESERKALEGLEEWKSKAEMAESDVSTLRSELQQLRVESSEAAAKLHQLELARAKQVSMQVELQVELKEQQAERAAEQAERSRLQALLEEQRALERLKPVEIVHEPPMDKWNKVLQVPSAPAVNPVQPVAFAQGFVQEPRTVPEPVARAQRRVPETGSFDVLGPTVTQMPTWHSRHDIEVRHEPDMSSTRVVEEEERGEHGEDRQPLAALLLLALVTHIT